jgi:hypothetical protein
LALIIPVPLFESAKPPFPMVPAPTILLEFVRVTPLTFCRMKTPPPPVSDNVGVPAPDSVVLAPRPRIALFAGEFTLIAPPLMICGPLLLTCKLNTLPTWPAARVTVVGPAFTIHVFVLPVGTPLFQVPAVLKSPPSETADVEGEPSEPHWAEAL